MTFGGENVFITSRHKKFVIESVIELVCLGIVL